ncbi:MAG: hypothetical protein IE926_05695, partial [Micrococcales bacterium]|nr:hypothetical protein [Micrococcales bacterium]
MNARDRIALFVLAGVVFVVTVSAFVALTIAGKDTDALVSLVAPVLTGLFLVGVLGSKIDATKAAADTAVAQTNGALDARFLAHAETAATKAALAALEHAGVAPPAIVVPSD